MSKSVKNRANKLLNVLISTVFCCSTLQVFVLCVGADGHVAVEPAFHNHCRDEGHPHHAHKEQSSSNATAAIISADCAPCTDISLADTVTPGRKVNKAGLDLPDAALISQFACYFYPAAAVVPKYPSVCPYFTPLSSVVLLV